MSYLIFVPEELKTIKKRIRTYVGGSDTAILLQFHLIFDFLTKMDDPKIWKKCQKSRKMKILIWVFYGFVTSNMYCNCVLNLFLEFFHEIGTQKKLTDFLVEIIEFYHQNTSILGICKCQKEKNRKNQFFTKIFFKT